jgi:hypothetical protein
MIEADIKGEPRIEPEGFRERDDEGPPRRDRREYDPMSAYDTESGGDRRGYGDR